MIYRLKRRPNIFPTPLAVRIDYRMPRLPRRCKKGRGTPPDEKKGGNRVHERQLLCTERLSEVSHRFHYVLSSQWTLDYNFDSVWIMHALHSVFSIHWVVLCRAVSLGGARAYLIGAVSKEVEKASGFRCASGQSRVETVARARARHFQGKRTRGLEIAFVR